MRVRAGSVAHPSAHTCAVQGMLRCMKTTIDIGAELLRQAKKRAIDEGVTLREVVETALRMYLAARPKRAGYRLQWRVESGRLLPGVDLDDREALFDRMGGRS